MVRIRAEIHPSLHQFRHLVASALEYCFVISSITTELKWQVLQFKLWPKLYTDNKSVSFQKMDLFSSNSDRTVNWNTLKSFELPYIFLRYHKFLTLDGMVELLCNTIRGKESLLHIRNFQLWENQIPEVAGYSLDIETNVTSLQLLNAFNWVWWLWSLFNCY